MITTNSNVHFDSWGVSSGAISVSLQMIANGGDTEGLFRGAFMHSGSPIPFGDISHGQRTYDQLVAYAGCQNATDSLQCLREVPYDVLKAGMNASPSLFSRLVSEHNFVLGWFALVILSSPLVLYLGVQHLLGP